MPSTDIDPPIHYVQWSNIYAAQRAIHAWANQTFPGREPVASLTKLVMEEIPELLEHKKRHGVETIGEELADCFILLLDLAELWHVDVPQAIKTKMLKNAKRRWNKDLTTGFYNHVEDTPLPDPRMWDPPRGPRNDMGT